MTRCPTPRTVTVRAEEYEVGCGSRYCDVCGLRWQGDQRAQAVAASEVLDGGVALITVTAPGSRYFTGRARLAGDPPSAHMRGWNARARRRWRALHLAASGPMRRWAKKNKVHWRVLYRSWEYQKRGVLHLHLVVPYGTPEERRFTDLYVFNLWSCAKDHRFGYVLGGDVKQQPRPGVQPRIVPADGPATARYVCKYVASTGAGKGSMVEVAQRTAQRGSVLYVSPTLTRRSLTNMTTLRARRRIARRYPWSAYSHESWKAACLVDSIQRGRPPLTETAARYLWRAARRTGAALWADRTTGEVRSATVAPPPAQMARTCALVERMGHVLVPHLASVLVRDPERPWSGGIHTEAWEVGPTTR